MALKQADRLESNNPQAYGVVRATEISGHKSVNTLDDLYSLPDCILSDSKNNTGNDAIGQIWYVIEENCDYRLISWDNRKSSQGWQKEESASYLSEQIETITGSGEGSISKAVSDLEKEILGDAQTYTDFGLVENKIAEFKVNNISDGNGTTVTNDSGAVKVNLSIDENTLKVGESNKLTIEIIDDDSINSLFT